MFSSFRSRLEGDSPRKSQEFRMELEEPEELPASRSTLRRQWASMRQEWSIFLAQRQSEQDDFVERLIAKLPQGLESRTTMAMNTKADLGNIFATLPEMPALSPPSQFRSEKLELSEDFATEAACRMKQFEDDEEEAPMSRVRSNRRSRNQSQISEEEDKLQSVREFEGRTNALEGLASSMQSSKRLQAWISHLPFGRRCLRATINWMAYLGSLEEPERYGCCNCVLQSALFGTLCTMTILANVVVILYTANWTMANESFDVPMGIAALDTTFCCIYLLESTLKLIVHRAYFFWNEDAAWNSFDLLLVILAVYDQVMFFVWRGQEVDVYNANMNFMRSLRIVKVSRILRLVRVIRVFRDLRCMLFSILWSFSSLFWCLVLIFFVILVFSLLLVQLVTESIIQQDIPESVRQEVSLYFGSVETTMATLYMSSTGGVDWKGPYEVLANSNAGELGLLAFLAYIAFFEFAVFNVLTGVFVDHAMKVSAADRELALAEQNKKERTEAERLRETCRLIDADGDGKISWPEFHAFLHYGNGYRSLASLDLDIFDSKKFFKNLMIMTNQREIEITQFVSGCMRMKGCATGIDLHSLYSDLDAVQRRQDEMQNLLSSALRLLQERAIRERSQLYKEGDAVFTPGRRSSSELPEGPMSGLFQRDPLKASWQDSKLSL